jgi:hypothetical protein
MNVQIKMNSRVTFSPFLTIATPSQKPLPPRKIVWQWVAILTGSLKNLFINFKRDKKSLTEVEKLPVIATSFCGVAILLGNLADPQTLLLSTKMANLSDSLSGIKKTFLPAIGTCHRKKRWKE